MHLATAAWHEARASDVSGSVEAFASAQSMWYASVGPWHVPISHFPCQVGFLGDMGDDHMVAISNSLGDRLTSLKICTNENYMPDFSGRGIASLRQFSALRHLTCPGAGHPVLLAWHPVLPLPLSPKHPGPLLFFPPDGYCFHQGDFWSRQSGEDLSEAWRISLDHLVGSGLRSIELHAGRLRTSIIHSFSEVKPL